MTRSTTWAALALAAGLTLTGCTADDPAPEESPAAGEEQVEETSAPGVDFPAEVAPDYPESTEVSRSAEAAGELIGFQLVSTTDDEADAVLDFYRSHLEGLDFQELTTAEEGEDRTVNYQRSEGTEVVTVTVGPDPADAELRRVIVSGTIAAADAEDAPAEEGSEEDGAEPSDEGADDGGGDDQGMSPAGALTPADDIAASVGACLRDFLRERREELSAISPSAVDLVDRLAPMLVGGKRIRATLLWWGYELAVGADPAPAGLAHAAAALELLQAAALIHDDIIDHSLTRRGLPAVHADFAAAHREAVHSGDAAEFGTAAGIIVGDLCLAWHERAFETSGLPLRHAPEVLRLRDHMRSDVMVGQYLDILIQAEHLGPAEIRQDAWQVLTYKSAKYSVEQPLLLGAALGGGSESLLQALSDVGLPLGQAFQLRDDVLGVFGDAERTGKPAGDDLREGKRTVMLGFALEEAPAGALDRIGAEDLSAEEIEHLRRVIVDSGALRRTEEEISRLADQARAATTRLGGLGIAAEAVEVLTGFAERIAVRSA